MRQIRIDLMRISEFFFKRAHQRLRGGRDLILSYFRVNKANGVFLRFIPCMLFDTGQTSASLPHSPPAPSPRSPAVVSGARRVPAFQFLFSWFSSVFHLTGDRNRQTYKRMNSHICKCPPGTRGVQPFLIRSGEPRATSFRYCISDC
ncbi:hypothetical protein MKMG_01950 [Methanogenium sp. MK-MG]|nr:hypothetical protein MKMG_01950 [Methanogenium sp. MK-MG]